MPVEAIAPAAEPPRWKSQSASLNCCGTVGDPGSSRAQDHDSYSSNYLFEAGGDRLSLTATDLDLSLRTSCNAKVKKEGSCTIPARKLHDYVKLLPDADITIKPARKSLGQHSLRAFQYQDGRHGAVEFPEPASISHRRRGEDSAQVCGR